MRTALFILLSLFSTALPAQAQSTSPDSHTLQTILDEIHKLRQELQSATVATQRSQILIYRVRLQMDTVERLNQRLEQAHNRVTQARNEQERFLAEKKNAEDQLEQTQDPANHRNLENMIAALKNHLEATSNDAPEAEAKEATLANELRTEQAKLGDLQEQLERLDKRLEAQQLQSQARP